MDWKAIFENLEKERMQNMKELVKGANKFNKLAEKKLMNDLGA